MLGHYLKVSFSFLVENLALWLKMEDIMVFLRILDTPNLFDTPFWAPTFKILAKTMILVLGSIWDPNIFITVHAHLFSNINQCPLFTIVQKNEIFNLRSTTSNEVVSINNGIIILCQNLKHLSIAVKVIFANCSILRKTSPFSKVIVLIFALVQTFICCCKYAIHGDTSVSFSSI